MGLQAYLPSPSWGFVSLEVLQLLGVLSRLEFICAARMAERSQAPDPNASFLTLPSKDALNADLLPFTLFFFT